jgi:hypothetical protein
MFEAKMVAQLWRCDGLVSGDDTSSAREWLTTRQADGDEVLLCGYVPQIRVRGGVMQMSTLSPLEEWFPDEDPLPSTRRRPYYRCTVCGAHQAWRDFGVCPYR